jgi:hypothetical protein
MLYSRRLFGRYVLQFGSLLFLVCSAAAAMQLDTHRENQKLLVRAAKLSIYAAMLTLASIFDTKPLLKCDLVAYIHGRGILLFVYIRQKMGLKFENISFI